MSDSEAGSDSDSNSSEASSASSSTKKPSQSLQSSLTTSKETRWDTENYQHPFQDPKFDLNLDWLDQMEGLDPHSCQRDWEENREHLLNSCRKRLGQTKKSKNDYL